MNKFNFLYQKFKESGGVLEIKIFNNINNTTGIHFDFAKKFLKDRGVNETNWAEFEKARRALTPEQFFGIYFDFDSYKPLIRGKSNEYLNFFFRYDQVEKLENVMNELIQDNVEKFKKSGPGFSYAFLEPPYSVRFGNTIKEVGDFFLEFSKLLFGNFERLEVFQWPTTNSYFDAGNEWWGSFFWTVYNPEKKRIIVICGSQTD